MEERNKNAKRLFSVVEGHKTEDGSYEFPFNNETCTASIDPKVLNAYAEMAAELGEILMEMTDNGLFDDFPFTPKEETADSQFENTIHFYAKCIRGTKASELTELAAFLRCQDGPSFASMSAKMSVMSAVYNMAELLHRIRMKDPSCEYIWGTGRINDRDYDTADYLFRAFLYLESGKTAIKEAAT